MGGVASLLAQVGGTVPGSSADAPIYVDTGGGGTDLVQLALPALAALLGVWLGAFLNGRRADRQADAAVRREVFARTLEAAQRALDKMSEYAVAAINQSAEERVRQDAYRGLLDFNIVALESSLIADGPFAQAMVSMNARLGVIYSQMRLAEMRAKDHRAEGQGALVDFSQEVFEMLVRIPGLIVSARSEIQAVSWWRRLRTQDAAGDPANRTGT